MVANQTFFMRVLIGIDSLWGFRSFRWWWWWCYRSAYVISAYFPKPDFIPSIHADFGPYLSFDLNSAAIWAIATELYYLILTPGVTVSLNPSDRVPFH